MGRFGVLCLLALIVAWAAGDSYMQSPRGSNNRLNGSGTNRDNNNRLCDTQNNAKGGYVYGPSMYYYVGSRLTVEWTTQHGCGPESDQKNLHCQIILQYMCSGELRDGATEETPPDDAATYNTIITDPTADKTFGGGQVYEFGMHESYQYYQDCKQRERNKGLYIADRGLGGNDARFTRQNNGGGRSGFECPEERDYYPYWHPTPWKDIVIMTSDISRCDYYIQKSENNRGRNYCTIPQYNNEFACNQGGGSWERADSNGAPSPECKLADMSRDNHLGNGPLGFDNTYNWTIPDDTNDNCVLRLRYNISTGDYDGWRTDYNSNGQKAKIKNNPFKQFGGKNLSYAVNTAQFGRTFQDRSHRFSIRSRPTNIVDTKRIFNLNVRGKRGNIVQVYPAVEYDFVPNRLTVRKGDSIHFQWTGGDTNPQGNDGEGKRGTDRSNMVEIGSISKNLASNLEDTTFFTPAVAMVFAHLNQMNCSNYTVLLARNGGDAGEAARDPQNCMKLNAADRYFDGGLQEVRSVGEYHFVSTRNNNFSNRSQKSTISVVPFLPTWAIVLVSLGGFVCLLSIMVSGLAFYGKARPDTWIGQTWTKLT